MNAVPPETEAWRGQTYYDVPPVRRSHWNWKVGTYIGFGGMAGAAQLIAALAGREDRRLGGGLRRQAHWMGSIASAIGAGLLVADLRTPHRFANMLRIFRPTSPMSLGSYILGVFGLASATGAMAELLAMRLSGRRRARLAQRVAEAAQVPAAVAGAGMSVYTAALLSSTSTPLWAAAPGMMGARFGSAAFAAGAAALSLGARRRGEERVAERLDRLALLAAGAGLVASVMAEGSTRQAGVRPSAGEHALGLGALAMAEGPPVLGYSASLLMPGAGRELSLLSSLALVLGNVAMRNQIIRAGNASADRPGNYFRLTQPRPRRPATAAARLPGTGR